MDAKIMVALQEIVGDTYVYTDRERLTVYGKDETEDLVFLPHVAVRPGSVDEVSAVLSLCNAQGIPVTPRGAGTGLSGGALPVMGGVVMAMDRLNHILEIDEANYQATVEPGVINQVFQEAVAAKGLYYPPDPASKGSCFLGGNMAESSGGPHAVKYGITRDYVLNLEVVLPTGEVIWTGANVLKNSTGYNLTQLMIGSEGTLGVITKIRLKLIPHPTRTLLMFVPFVSAEKACAAVAAVFQAGITPSALEFMERDALLCARSYDDNITIDPGEAEAYLLIEVDGFEEEVLIRDCERISEVLEGFDAGEVLFAESEAQKETLWYMRRKVAEAVKHVSVYKEEDTVVPRAALPKLLNGVKEIGKKYGFRSVCYGHAGDGNLHVNILKDNMSDEAWNVDLPKGIREIFRLTVELGGTLSGEHGIGWVQKSYMDIAFGKTQLEIMKGIKRVFDPKGILNPGKIFPDDE
ncbi:MAG: FAD-binding protein [Flavobacteriales bacterium]|nr:FAD-binding protein [Flavobacteriales bacterium]MCB9447714.1 FAD-binding protein [Flavobacteriales bacterium]